MSAMTGIDSTDDERHFERARVWVNIFEFRESSGPGPPHARRSGARPAARPVGQLKKNLISFVQWQFAW